MLNENFICVMFAVVSAFSYLILSMYFGFQTGVFETVEAHSVMIVLPREDQLVKDKTKLNAMNKTHTEMAEDTLKSMTLRDIHSHFSSNFGDIHRIYVSRDFNNLYRESVKMHGIVRHELAKTYSV